MREILFRGKRLDNGEWVEGNLFVSDTDGSTYILAGSRRVTIEWEVDPGTVGQYTGLKDKHGKRIFEGDILGSWYDDLYPDDVAIEVVQWFRNGWYIRQEKICRMRWMNTEFCRTRRSSATSTITRNLSKRRRNLNKLGNDAYSLQQAIRRRADNGT